MYFIRICNNVMTCGVIGCLVLQGDEEELCAIKYSPQEVKLHIDFNDLVSVIAK